MAFGDDQLRALGRIVVAYSRLEGSLGAAITRFANVTEFVGATMVTRLPFANAVLVFRKLAPLATGDASLLERAAALGTEVEKLGQERNLLIHSTWAPFMSTP